jgi:hypothetical protein
LLRFQRFSDRIDFFVDDVTHQPAPATKSRNSS